MHDNFSESNEIEISRIANSEVPKRINTKRDVSHENYPMRPRRQQQLSGRAQFYNLLMDILATMQSSTKNDIRQAKKRELQRGSIHIADK